MAKVAIRVTRSRKKLMDLPVVKSALASAMDAEVKPHFENEFDKIVANWKHNPEFAARKHITPDQIKITVFPTKHKDIWKYVTSGTRPHKIRAKRGKSLAFPWGGKGSYSPKTRVGGHAGYGGPGKTSGPMIFPQSVNHPGSAAREFERRIMKANKAWYSRTMENIWRRAIRAASK